MASSKLRAVSTTPSASLPPAPEMRGPGSGSDEPTITVTQADGERPRLDPTASFPSRPGLLLDEKAATIGHIGRYALKHRLGQGGLGTVYAAHDPLLSRLIAVKTLHVEIAPEQRSAFNALFLREARAAARLSHPQIVTVFDAGVSDERAYIAMELLKGRDLRQLRQEGWRPTPAQAALIVRRVADALAYAHGKGVVHRDIKPANIFMTGRTQPRVLDFGIARLAHEREAGSPEMAAGSPHYMAPEQARHQNVDRRADVFSLGVVLYELLTDSKPFRGATLAEITKAVMEHEPPPAYALDPSVPEDLSAIAARAMAKDPARRYRSASALSRDLRHWLEEHAASDENDPPPAPSRLRRALTGVALVGTGAVLASAVWFFVAPAALAERLLAQTGLVSAPRAGPASVGAPSAASVLARSGIAATGGGGAPAAAASTAAPSNGAAPLTGAAAAADALPAARPGSRDLPATPPSTDALLAFSLGADPRAAAGASAPSRDPAAREAHDANRNAEPRDARAARKPEARRTADASRDLRARDARAPTVAVASEAAAPPTGVVHLAVSPWGRVEVDGTPAGVAPPLTQLTLPQGRHRITLSNEDFPPYNASIEVTADQPVTLRHRFGS
jgi:serine/threonine-protein kinase